MDPVDDLVVWLRAQLDVDERLAQAAQDGNGETGHWKKYEVDREPGEVESPFDSSAVIDGQGDHVVYDEGAPSIEEALHIAEHDPARVLREVEADRLIIARYVELRDRCAADAQDYADWLAGKPVPERLTGVGRYETAQRDGLAFVLRVRALPRSDRPGYQEAWRP